MYLFAPTVMTIAKEYSYILCSENENMDYCYLPSRNRYQAIYRIESGYTGIQVKFIYLLFCVKHWSTCTIGRAINCSGAKVESHDIIALHFIAWQAPAI